MEAFTVLIAREMTGMGVWSEFALWDGSMLQTVRLADRAKIDVVRAAFNSRAPIDEFTAASLFN